ncbi:MAG: hypothetical protein ACT4QC_18450 [Planctomycetaceae bacterium]
MYYLYGNKTTQQSTRRLAATFDSAEQLRAYVGWATLSRAADGTSKFEQGSALVGFQHWEMSGSPLTDDDAASVDHNPSPSML